MLQAQRFRAFISIRSPRGIIERISTASEDLNRSWAKLSGEEGMPITLFFFESIGTRDIGTIIKIMDSIHTRRFKIKVKGVDVFIPKKPRVLFGSVEENRSLQDLYAALKASLDESGIPVETRPFIPHITIARIDKPNTEELSGFLSKYKDYEFGEFLCTEIKLSKSELTGKGPIYTDLHIKHLD
jgi:2'-5' RNA ligase